MEAVHVTTHQEAERKAGLGSGLRPSMAHFWGPASASWAPPPKGSTGSQNNTPAGTTVRSISLWQTFQIQTITPPIRSSFSPLSKPLRGQSTSTHGAPSVCLQLVSGFCFAAGMVLAGQCCLYLTSGAVVGYLPSGLSSLPFSSLLPLHPLSNSCLLSSSSLLI